MNPADLYDDDPGIMKWSHLPYAVVELRAALAAAEARAERAEAKVARAEALASEWDRVAFRFRHPEARALRAALADQQDGQP